MADELSTAKVLQTWMIVSPVKGKRIVNVRPTRWDATKGVIPEDHEVQWDETVYEMKAELMTPEQIDGLMVKVNDEEPEGWEKEPPNPLPMTLSRWMAQEIFRRIQRIVPRNTYGPRNGMKSSCIGSAVHLELGSHGAFTITVKQEGES